MNELLMNAAVNGEGPQMGHKKLGKRVLLTVIPIVLAALIAGGINIFAYGMPISGAPKPQDVASVSVKYGEEGGEAVEYTDPEKIELAVKLLSSLNYVPFQTPDENEEVGVMLIYNMKDGSRLVAAANSLTGWWKGKAYVLKEKAVFFNLAQGVFPEASGAAE